MYPSRGPVNETSRKLCFCSYKKYLQEPIQSSKLVPLRPLTPIFCFCPGISPHTFMTSQLEIQIPSAFDPFKEVDINTVAAPGSGSGSKGAVHIRVQQRNGRKCLTTVQGINKSFSYNKILKDLKKEFCCNGNVVDDLELGHVIQLQGDQRKNAAQFLVQAGVAKKEHIKIHGF